MFSKKHSSIELLTSVREDSRRRPLEVESVWKSLATNRARENGCLFFSFHNHLGTGILVPLHVFT